MTRLRSLIEEKDRIENELKDVFSRLDAEPCGRSGSVIDTEGFPRTDCDLYEVAPLREKMHQLKNDLKTVMEEIYEALQGE
mmetsp:Transcript_18922/g.29679  ORF Transcript_18922/g.29679 Transcript_18922/m.29679 type:complete len:81 (+) Transcript_18922:56-298(+)